MTETQGELIAFLLIFLGFIVLPVSLAVRDIVRRRKFVYVGKHRVPKER